MKDNDLSNRPIPRIGLVFENALGFLSDDKRPGFNRLMGKKRYREAVDLWSLSDLMVAVVWDRVWKNDLQIDVFTFLGPVEFGHALGEVLDEQQLPINLVWATTPQVLGRSMAMQPDLVRVYHGLPEHSLIFGSAGRYMKSANEFGRI